MDFGNEGVKELKNRPYALRLKFLNFCKEFFLDFSSVYKFSPMNAPARIMLTKIFDVACLENQLLDLVVDRQRRSVLIEIDTF